MWTISKAKRFRELIELAMSVSPLTDAQASEMPTMFPKWEDELEAKRVFTAEDVEKRVRVQYGGSLYVVTLPHTVQADWTPDTAASLYLRVNYRAGYREIPEHITSVHPFHEGEEGIDADGVVWVSKYDNNVYTPVQYADNWYRKEAGE